MWPPLHRLLIWISHGHNCSTVYIIGIYLQSIEAFQCREKFTTMGKEREELLQNRFAFCLSSSFSVPLNKQINGNFHEAGWVITSKCDALESTENCTAQHCQFSNQLWMHDVRLFNDCHLLAHSHFQTKSNFQSSLECIPSFELHPLSLVPLRKWLWICVCTD